MIKVTAILFAILYCLNISALGLTGHRVTGEIAEKYLTEDTRVAVSKLLGNKSLAEVSNYVDEMRSSPNGFWKKVTSPYHYVTVPKGKTYAEVGAPEQGDAVFALNKYSDIILDPAASDRDKEIALKFIIHLIGDLHQPLHVGSGLDRGANDVKVKFFGRDYNLHSVWDSGMINRKELSYTEWSNWLGQQITAEDVANWSDSDPLVWIKESADIRDTIYPDGSFIGYDYLFQQLPTLKLRLKQAGVRIAIYLNILLDKQQLKVQVK